KPNPFRLPGIERIPPPEPDSDDRRSVTSQQSLVTSTLARPVGLINMVDTRRTPRHIETSTGLNSDNAGGGGSNIPVTDPPPAPAISQGGSDANLRPEVLPPPPEILPPSTNASDDRWTTRHSHRRDGRHARRDNVSNPSNIANRNYNACNPM
ncbi:hypothetical protein Dimus_024443, partial [Dionaea muscipula]